MKRGPRDLQREVLDRDLCTTCGLCIGLCPYLKTFMEKVAVIYPCGLDEGNCYNICPRTVTDLEALDSTVFGRIREDHILGHHMGIYFARSRDSELHQRGQYGGVASTILASGLDEGEFDGAVVAGRTPDGFPAPFLARTREDVTLAAGSRYSASPTLVAFNQGVREGLQNIAVVGRPCQVAALRKLQQLNPDLGGHVARLVIGLFCFWALNPEFYDYLASHQIDLSRVTKMDIPQNDFLIYTHDGDGPLRLPFDEVKAFAKATCDLCFDVTSELADVSVGSTEYDDGWSTLVVRTLKGEEAVEKAVGKGALEIKPYPVERIHLLRNAAANKKKRVLAALRQLPAGGTTGYLVAPDDYFSPFEPRQDEEVS